MNPRSNLGIYFKVDRQKETDMRHLLANYISLKEMEVYMTKQHPNSLKNLKPMWTSETAKEAQKNSVLARKANAEARQQLNINYG